MQHYALALARGAGAEVVLATYQRLLREVRWFQRKEGGGEAYNVVMTRAGGCASYPGAGVGEALSVPTASVCWGWCGWRTARRGTCGPSLGWSSIWCIWGILDRNPDAA